MRRATIRTQHANPAVVAAAIRPDNTTEMRTTVDGETIETVIERETIGGLQTNLDDYVVNLQLAEAVSDHERNETMTTDDPTETRQ